LLVIASLIWLVIFFFTAKTSLSIMPLDQIRVEEVIGAFDCLLPRVWSKINFFDAKNFFMIAIKFISLYAYSDRAFNLKELGLVLLAIS